METGRADHRTGRNVSPGRQGVPAGSSSGYTGKLPIVRSREESKDYQPGVVYGPILDLVVLGISCTASVMVRMSYLVDRVDVDTQDHIPKMSTTVKLDLQPVNPL